MSNKVSRVFLVDHMCILPYGHNLNALILFGDALKPYFDSVIRLVPLNLPDYAEQSRWVQKVLSYPYDGLIDVYSKEKSNQTNRQSITISARFSAKLSLFRRVIRRMFYTSLQVILGYDYVRARTKRNWRRIFKCFNIGVNDTIFFPSAEYFGCMSLLDFVQKLPIEHRPSIHFRMIGVLENANYSLQSARPNFFACVRRALTDGVKLSLSAETPSYCTLIARLINIPVIYMPYPLAHAQQPIKWGPIKVVASPGQGRRDKGFFRLYSIISKLQTTGNNTSFSFDVQNMRYSDRESRARYESILKNTPNLLLRSSQLSQDQIYDIYSASDILLLPYDPKTYALRGSAVYQEGLAIGRPVICSKGLGLSELVLRYGNGLLATSDSDFAHKLNMLAQYSKQSIEKNVTSARKIYQQDFNAGLKMVIESITREQA